MSALKRKNPRLEIYLQEIEDNIRTIVDKGKNESINMVGVTKGVQADKNIIKSFLNCGVRWLADSRLENIKKIREEENFEGIVTLLRLPMISEVESVVNLTDISLNSEIKTLEILDKTAKRLNKKHGIILMVDVGDRREGILPENVLDLVKESFLLENLSLCGLALNVGCFGGVLPTRENANVLVELKYKIEKTWGKRLPLLSGGSTCGLTLIWEDSLPREINQLRVGEGFLLGRDSVRQVPIPGTSGEGFRLVGEIIEIKEKPSLPLGEMGCTPGGEKPEFADRGYRRRAIIALGKQDVNVFSLVPYDEDVTIEGASSDHLIVDITCSKKVYQVGNEMFFSLSYEGVYTAMSSAYIDKVYFN